MVSIHDCLALMKHYSEGMVEEGCSPHDSQEAEQEEAEREEGPKDKNIPFQVPPLVTHLLPLGPTS